VRENDKWVRNRDFSASVEMTVGVEGDNVVEKGYPKYVVHVGGEHEGKVYINGEQYFDGVRVTVWEFMVGGYQVCEKWLKDRRGRALSYEDIVHYQKVVVALGETIGLMGKTNAWGRTSPYRINHGQRYPSALLRTRFARATRQKLQAAILSS